MRYVDLPGHLEKALEVDYGATLVALKAGQPDRALVHAETAWALLPEPKYQWSMSYLTATLLIKARRAAGAHAQAVTFATWCAETTAVPYERSVFYFFVGASLYDEGFVGPAYEAFERSWQETNDFGAKSEGKHYAEFFHQERQTRRTKR